MVGKKFVMDQESLCTHKWCKLSYALECVHAVCVHMFINFLCVQLAEQLPIFTHLKKVMKLLRNSDTIKLVTSS